MEGWLFSLLGDKSALIDGDSGQILTYQDLQIAGKAFPIQGRSLIFLFCKNCLEDIAAYICAMNGGMVVCLLDGHMHDAFKQHLVSLYAPDYIYSAADASDWKDYQKISTTIYQSKKDGPLLNEKLQLLLTTSGTTGNPKLIRLSKENLVSNAKSIIDFLEIDSNERAIASLPFHYSYGLSVLHSHLLAGASLVLTQSSVAQKPFWEVLKKFGCSSLAGVPYTYKVMERIGFLEMDLPSLRTLTQAGGKLDAASIVKFHQKIKRFFVMYGQTEATARIAFLPPAYLPEKASAIGKAIPGGFLKIVADQTEVTTPKAEGELVYCGSNVMLGYAKEPGDLAKGDELGGVLHTEDVGYFDEEGIFYVSGRMKRISKVYGWRLNLDDIEQELSLFGNAAATTTEDQIIIYLENATEELCRKCVSHLATLYEIHPSTFRCLPIAQLPRTSAGKVDYKKLP